MAEIQSQLVEYLTVNEGLLGDPTSGEPVVILTIRPEPLESFEVVNLAIPVAQSHRLLADLTNLLAPFVLLLGLLAATLGCSAKVEVERASTDEKAKTAIQLDLMQGRPSEPPPKHAKSTTIINVGTGYVHIEEAPLPVVPNEKPPRPKTGFNTTIGLPSTYTAHGPLAFLGYMVVCLLVAAAVVLMLATVGHKTGGRLLPILVLLVAAAVILQALPQADSGVQFIPQLPWQCSGFFSTLASIVCWMVLLSAVLIAVTGCLDAPKVFSGLVMAVMGINLLVSFGSGPSGPEVASTAPVSSKSQPATIDKEAAVPVDPPKIRSPEPVATPKAPEPPLRPIASESRPVTISNNTFVVNIRGGDIHNETHVHIQAPPPRAQERITIHREVEAKPPRRSVEDPCDRGQREHEARVKKWREFPKGY